MKSLILVGWVELGSDFKIFLRLGWVRQLVSLVGLGPGFKIFRGLGLAVGEWNRNKWNPRSGFHAVRNFRGGHGTKPAKKSETLLFSVSIFTEK